MFPTQFPFYTERYYNKYRTINMKKTPDNNYCVMVHSNGLAMLCLDLTTPFANRESTMP